MRYHNRDSMNNTGLDAMLEYSLPELPPDDVVNNVTPWRKSMKRIFVGMVLNTLTLNFWGLNYILPAMGIILSLLGFRVLREESAWFKSCWFIAGARMACFMAILIINATIFQSMKYVPQILGVLDGINLVLNLLLVCCFWGGFRAVRQKAGLSARVGGGVALIVWYTFLCLLAFLQFSGQLLLIIMVISYLFIIRSLFRMSRELDEAGYAIWTALIRVPDWIVVTAVFVLLAGGVSCAYLFFNSYPMEWQAAKISEDTEIAELKDYLIRLGFPEAVLEDLTDEDIKACEGAVKVVVEVNDYPVNDGHFEKTYNYPASYENPGYYQVYNEKELHITGIAVELPEEREQWKIFHHFWWRINPGFYGTECIQLFPAFRQGEGWDAASDITGQVLYDRDGQVYAAPYYSLGSETYTSTDFLLGEQTSTDIFAAFSLPKDGENHRGYLSYTIRGTQDDCAVDAWLNYTHQKSWRQYPVITAMKSCMMDGWSQDAFLTIQDALQFYCPSEKDMIQAQ